MTWDDGQPYLEEVSAGVFAYIQPDGSWMINNMGFVVGDNDGAIVIDGAATEKRTRAFLAQVAEHSSGDPKFVVNTHHHPDHTYGNCFFPASTKIVADTKCRQAMAQFGLEATTVVTAPDYGDVSVRLPDVTFSGRLTLWSGDRAVELISLGPAHTTNDVIAWLPEERIAFTGDLAFAGGHPFLLEGSVSGYPKALKAIRELQPETIVPGHGAVAHGQAAMDLLDRLDGYVTWLSGVAEEGHKAGLSPLETAERNKDNPYADWQESERFAANLHRAYSELDGNPIDTVLPVPKVWPDMVKFHGGPIPCHA